jgi:hypothetical protein
VHECDRLLRVYYVEKNSLPSAESPIISWQPSPSFYVVYGNALLGLSNVETFPESETESCGASLRVSFIDEAIDRYETGLEMNRDSGSDHEWMLRLGLAKSLLHKVGRSIVVSRF